MQKTIINKLYLILKNPTFNLTWPIFIELLLRVMLGYFSILVLSKYSDKAVAAVGVCNQISYLCTLLFSIINVGTTVTISQFLGANDKQNARNIINASIFSNLIFGCLISFNLFIFSKVILQAMGLKNEILQYGIEYLHIIGGLIFIQAVSTTISAIIRSYKFTKISMNIMFLVNALNIIGSCIAILKPFGIQQLGVCGVAFSVVISQFIGLVILLIFLKFRIGIDFNIHIFSVESKQAIKKILQIGLPSAGEGLSSHIAQLVITSFISSMGDIQLITRIYTYNLMMFIMLFANAIGQATQIIIGHTVGANKLVDAYKICLKHLRYAILFSASTAIIFLIFSQTLLGIFTVDKNVIEMGKKLLLIAIILESGRSINFVVINSLKAAGDVKFPVAFGVLSMWLCGVLLAYFLGIYLNFGLIGIWIAYCLDEWTRGVIMLIRWKSKKWFMFTKKIINVS